MNVSRRRPRFYLTRYPSGQVVIPVVYLVAEQNAPLYLFPVWVHSIVVFTLSILELFHSICSYVGAVLYFCDAMKDLYDMYFFFVLLSPIGLAPPTKAEMLSLVRDMAATAWQAQEGTTFFVNV